MKGLDVITQNRAPPQAAKPAYKDYQKFLKNYNESKSDQTTSPGALSTNSSSSSVPSMISEADNVPMAFNDYLQNYGTKKYSTVRPNLPKKNVKTEIFIQVNEDNDKESLHGRKFNTLKSRKPPGKIILTRQNSLNKCDNWFKWQLSPAAHQVCISPPPPKQELIPDEMIYAKTALLNELSSKPPKLNKSPSPTLKSAFEIYNPPPASVSSLPPPPPKLPDFTNKAPAISKTVNKVTPAPIPPKLNQSRPSFISEMQSRFNENSQNHQNPGRLSTVFNPGMKSPPLVINANSPTKFHQHGKSSETEVDSSIIVQNGINGKKSPPMTVNLNSEIPPPPPMHPPPKMTSAYLEIKPTIPLQNQNGFVNGKKSPPTINALPPPPKFLTQHPKTSDMEGNTTTYVPVTDTAAGVDKSNPNVKKLVYNTYRGLLGAYNNRANNMVTMPKNTVVQDQGVTKQLESMELQGCLDKLNGRVNPSGENE